VSCCEVHDQRGVGWVLAVTVVTMRPAPRCRSGPFP
jgi:hypothetical protein